MSTPNAENKNRFGGVGFPQIFVYKKIETRYPSHTPHPQPHKEKNSHALELCLPLTRVDLQQCETCDATSTARITFAAARFAPASVPRLRAFKLPLELVFGFEPAQGIPVDLGDLYAESMQT